MSLDPSAEAPPADLAQLESFLHGAYTFNPPDAGGFLIPMPSNVNTSNVNTSGTSSLLNFETLQSGPQGVSQDTYWRPTSADEEQQDAVGVEDMLAKVKKGRGNVPLCQRPADLRYPISHMNPPIGCTGMVQPQPNPVSSKCAQVGWQYCYMCTCGFQFKVNNPEQAAICSLCLKSPSHCICATSGQVYMPIGLEPQQTNRATKAGEYVRHTRNPAGYTCRGCGMAPKGTACICIKAKGGKKNKKNKYVSADDAEDEEDDEASSLFDKPLAPVPAGSKRKSQSKAPARKKQKAKKKMKRVDSDDDTDDEEDDDSDGDEEDEEDDDGDGSIADGEEDFDDSDIEEAAMQKLLNFLADADITKWQATLKTAQELSTEYPSCDVDRLSKLIEQAYNTIVTAGGTATDAGAKPSAAAKPSAVAKPSSAKLSAAKPSSAKLSAAKPSAAKPGASISIVKGSYAGLDATYLSSNHAWIVVELHDDSRKHVSVRKSDCDLNHEIMKPSKPSQDPEVRQAAGLSDNRSVTREAMGLRGAPAQTMTMHPPLVKPKPKRKAASTYLVYTLRAGITMTGKKTLKSQLMKSPSGELSYLYDPDCQQQWTSYPGKYIPEYASGKHVYYDLDEAKAAVRDAAAKKKKKHGHPIGITVEKRRMQNTCDETEPEDDEEDEAPVQQPKAAPKGPVTPIVQSTGNGTEQPQTPDLMPTFTTDGKVYSTYEEAKAAADKAPKAMAIIRHASPEQYFVIPSMIADGSPVSTDSTITVDEVENVDLSGVTAAEVEAADAASDAVADSAAASSSTHAAAASSSTSSDGTAPSQYNCDECSNRLACCGCPDCKHYYCFFCIRTNSWVKEDTTDFQCPECGLITP